MKRYALVSAALLFCLSAFTHAAAIIWQDGDDGAPGGPFSTWDDPAGDGVLNTGVGGAGIAVGSHNRAAQITETNPGPGPVTEILHTTAVGWTGNYNTLNYKSLRVDFYSDSTRSGIPLRLYMEAGGVAWYYDVPTLSAGWQTVQADMAHLTETTYAFEGWYYEGVRDANQFHLDLGSVSKIGFELNYPVAAGQEYGFDNLNLYDEYQQIETPEPQTFVVLGFALLSLGVVFRRQFHTLVGVKVTTVR